MSIIRVATQSANSSRTFRNCSKESDLHRKRWILFRTAWYRYNTRIRSILLFPQSPTFTRILCIEVQSHQPTQLQNFIAPSCFLHRSIEVHSLIWYLTYYVVNLFLLSRVLERSVVPVLNLLCSRGATCGDPLPVHWSMMSLDLVCSPKKCRSSYLIIWLEFPARSLVLL